MKHKYLFSTMAAMVVAVLAPALSARGAEDKFTLARGVPADVFLCIEGQHNPEHAFVNEYWSEIWTAAKESGAGEDLMALVGSLIGGEQMTEVNRLKDRAAELLAGVDWSSLGGGEIVYAQRMSNPNFGQGRNVNMGPPDMLWLFRGQNAAKNYEGLVALIEGALVEIRTAAGPKAEWLAVVKEQRDGIPVATIKLADMPQMRFLVSLALREDVIVIAAGDQILDESLALLAGKGDKASLATSARYQAAFAKLPAPEDSKVFFDMQTMLMPIRGLIEFALAEGSGSNDVFLNAQDSGEASELNAQALSSYREGNQAKALELVQQAAEKAPKDSRILYNLACFNALNGNQEAALAALNQAVDAGCYAPQLISTDADLESLREKPEFKAALTKATEQAKAHAGADAEAPRKLAKRIMDLPGMCDYIAEVGYTKGRSVHSESVIALVPGAEKLPFYPVISGKPENAAFDRFLPQETKSFSVSGGFEIMALYQFVEDSFKIAGRDGEELWSTWEKWQQDANFDVRKNVLGWMGGDFVTVTLEDNQGSVLMWRVKDEAVAREKVGAAVEFLSTKLVEAAADNPALAMMSVRKSPAQHEKLEGFQNLFIGMSPQPVVWGVADGHLIFADKIDAIVTCLDTAKGAHPGIRKNERVMSEALVPPDSYVSVSLTDQRALGQELAAAIGMVSMMSGFASMAIPDEQARAMIGKASGILMKLTPVVSKINFFKSIASTTTFDGKVWHVHAVTHYVDAPASTVSAN